MGHVTLVNQRTFKHVMETGYVSISASYDGKQKLKTISDQFADLLNVKPGNLIFFWSISDKVDNTKNLGFIGYGIASDYASFVNSDLYPYKIPLSEIIIYENPLSEREALSLNREKKLWNLIGKKSLGRGRGLIHQTFFEDKVLIELLEKKSTAKNIKKFSSVKKIGEKIKINLSGSNISKNEFNNSESEITNWNMNSFPFVSDGQFSYEKTLEAFLIQKLRDNEFNDIIFNLGLESWEIVWFGNYLAYGVLGGNLDILILLKKNEEYNLIVLELKNENLNYEKTENVINQINEYEIEMVETFKPFIKKLITTKIVIAPYYTKSVNFGDVRFLEYQIINNEFSLK